MLKTIFLLCPLWLIAVAFFSQCKTAVMSSNLESTGTWSGKDPALFECRKIAKPGVQNNTVIRYDMIIRYHGKSLSINVMNSNDPNSAHVIDGLKKKSEDQKYISYRQEEGTAFFMDQNGRSVIGPAASVSIAKIPNQSGDYHAKFSGVFEDFSTARLPLPDLEVYCKSIDKFREI